MGEYKIIMSHPCWSFPLSWGHLLRTKTDCSCSYCQVLREPLNSLHLSPGVSLVQLHMAFRILQGPGAHQSSTGRRVLRKSGLPEIHLFIFSHSEGTWKGFLNSFSQSFILILQFFRSLPQHLVFTICYLPGMVVALQRLRKT